MMALSRPFREDIIVARSVHVEGCERVPFNEAQDNVSCVQNLYFGRKLARSCVPSEEIHSEPFMCLDFYY